MAESRISRVPRDVRAWLALQAVGTLRPRDTLALLRDGATPHVALARLGAPAPAEAAQRRAEAALERLSGTLLPFGRTGYPSALRALEDAPPVLTLRGDPASLDAPAVAIVGSRAASAHGRHVARRVAGELAEAGVVVISGLAFGIDAAAHLGALEAGGRSVAVQACGLDRVYPAAHRDLADRIAHRGAVVSEFPIGMAPRKAFFPLRNRLISGLAAAVLVVEARERSGSLVTARHALDQGVEVFAVPGPIGVPQHLGSNRLLRDGAAPLLETRDLLDALSWPSTRRGDAAPEPLSAEAAVVVAALQDAAADVDTLARLLGRAPAELAPTLLELELRERIALDRDGRWRALPESP